MERREKRTWPNQKSVLRELPDPLSDPEAVELSRANGLKDKQVQRPLKQIHVAFAHYVTIAVDILYETHAIDLSTFYTTVELS